MDCRFCILLSLVTAVLAQESRYSKTMRRDFTGTKQRYGPECDLTVDSGTCSGQFNRYFYNPASGKCELFSYTGCGGNLNNFESLAECNKRCICSRPVDAGPCNKQTLRYFYNKATDLCQLFIFGGCDGNNNNFQSATACNDVCKADGHVKSCTRRPEYGTCTNTTVRYYYDPNCDCCQTFQYSGCDGNSNNFETRAKCMGKCSGSATERQGGTISESAIVETATLKIIEGIPERCIQSKDTGGCRAKIVRYYYNSETNQCEYFIWGGCGGTANNFRSRRFCEQICVQ